MKNYLLVIIALCLSIVGGTKKQQVSPTPLAKEMRKIQASGQVTKPIIPGTAIWEIDFLGIFRKQLMP